MSADAGWARPAYSTFRRSLDHSITRSLVGTSSWPKFRLAIWCHTGRFDAKLWKLWKKYDCPHNPSFDGWQIDEEASSKPLMKKRRPDSLTKKTRYEAQRYITMIFQPFPWRYNLQSLLVIKGSLEEIQGRLTTSQEKEKDGAVGTCWHTSQPTSTEVRPEFRLALWMPCRTIWCQRFETLATNIIWKMTTLQDTRMPLQSHQRRYGRNCGGHKCCRFVTDESFLSLPPQVTFSSSRPVL